MWLFIAIVYTVSISLGIGIFIITIGILFPAKKVLAYWPPAREWMSKMFGLKTPELNQQNISVTRQRLVTFFHIVITLFYVIIGAAIVKVGVDVLLRNGFLGQNLIYMILR